MHYQGLQSKRGGQNVRGIDAVQFSAMRWLYVFEYGQGEYQDMSVCSSHAYWIVNGWWCNEWHVNMYDVDDTQV